METAHALMILMTKKLSHKKTTQVQANLQQALTLHQKGQLAQAQTLYERVLKIQPRHFDCLHLLGILAYQMNKYPTALELISKAIEINSKIAAPYSNIGLVFQALNQLDAALLNYDKAIALNPNYAEAHNNRGNALRLLMQLDEALASYDKAIALKPDFAEAYNSRGNTLSDLKRSDAALASYDKAIAINPHFAEAHNNRGAVLKDIKRLDEALVSCDRAIALKPNYAGAHNSRGNTLNDLKRPDEALISCDKAITLQPDFAEAHNNHGIALNALNRPNDALISFDKAIALKPNFAEAYNNRGNALKDIRRLNDALASYDTAIALKPDYVEAYSNRGNTLRDLKRLDEALISYGKAIALQPDCEFVLGNLLDIKMLLSDWQDLDQILKNYAADIRSSKKITTPFSALSLLDSPELHKRAAQIFTETMHPKKHAFEVLTKQAKNEKIRVGYYSADFRNHAVTFLTAELFEAHSRDRFEIYGFSFGPNANDEMHQRVSSAFDKFIDVRNKSDGEVAALSRELGIDIAVDLGGYTQNSRTGIFAARCAPVQVNYLGYPGTMGADYIDYVIGDKTVMPVESQSHFTEKIAYLPHSFQVNDSTRKISDRIFTRQELGLPETGFVFCCFNNNYKILPSTFDVWMRILKAVEGSVLWLLEVENNPAAAKNLRKEAESRGVDNHRLVFAKRMSYADYLARYRCADLFLDTLPYNAGTTASDALWAGLPVLTCMGKSFASRMAASLLKAIDLPELIMNSEADYEAKAIELASNSEKLSEIKRTLEENKLTTPLFDTRLFAKHLESAYESMYERYHAGLAPENIEVKAFN